MILIKNPGDSTSYRVYVDQIGDATVTGAAFVANGLTFGSATPDNTTTPKSVIVPVQGGSHGQIYQGTGTFSLSSGGPLVRPITIRVFSS